MLGFKRDKTPQQDNQIPYEVYETFRQSAERRRLFAVRLIAALAVVTLVIFGGVALSRKLLGNNSDKQPAQQTQQQTPQDDGQDQPADDTTQNGTTPAPQDSGNQEQQKDPDLNQSTVPKPE